MTASLARQQVESAMRMVDQASASAAEKAEMLMEIAMGIQQKPKSLQEIEDAIELYRRALALLGGNDVLLAARIQARLASALLLMPGEDPEPLSQARKLFETAITIQEQCGTAEEQAEAWMNLGLAIQGLSSLGRAKITDAIGAYQRALRIFDAEKHPAEFAILHNNLAVAYLSISMSDERAKMREALAVQSFEAALEVIDITDHPSEYAMLQNNLGNALQYASSAHMVENNLRAIQAYDEALKVRNPRDTPLEYANTIANKANALRNLPSDPTILEILGTDDPTELANALYQEAMQIFRAHGETAKAAQLESSLEEPRKHRMTQTLTTKNH